MFFCGADNAGIASSRIVSLAFPTLACQANEMPKFIRPIPYSGRGPVRKPKEERKVNNKIYPLFLVCSAAVPFNHPILGQENPRRAVDLRGGDARRLERYHCHERFKMSNH